ncbi:MAG: sigma-54-dependent Fis family transcriptional regulator [Verrucomicrobia bacterium]|nr:sigma-54-dependent Fis family transcriptional regulator [Verrucomicrobiota bacterium]
MSITLPPLLIVDDEKNMRLSLSSIVEAEGFDVRAVDSAEAALKLVGQEEFFMVITDARLGGMSGYELLGKLKAAQPGLPVLVITAYATPKLAAEAIKAGAMDYLAKPFEPEELLHAVGRCAERHRLLKENAKLRARVIEPYRLEQIIGECVKVRELRQFIQTVAPANATVLILGESGTGKELIAGALHTLSQRHEENYVRINCAAIPEALLESELFGHEKGAFTGALRLKLGRVEEADGGTIFLDEIGDMSRPLQAKLLRFLEDGSFTRVGGNEELRVDCRVIAATNRDIVDAIRRGDFREDLFHRLNVVQFLPPPLSERGEDVVLLADHFLRHFALTMNRRVLALSKAAQARLKEHHWPGNVRELRNVIERAVILETGPEIRPESLPDFHIESRLHRIEPVATQPETAGQSLDEAVSSYERDLINRVLEQNRFSLTRTADQLKITRHALRYRMQRLNINPADEEESPSLASADKAGETPRS